MDIVLRAAAAFFFVFALTRVIGRRELRSLEPFDLILLVMMGDLVQQGVTQSDMSVTGLMLAGGTVALCTVLAASARLNEIGSLAEVKWAILETNGQISFLARS